MPKITKRTVDSLKPGAIVWDSEVRGFGARCQRAGRSYVLKTRINGKQRWLTIGRHGSPWTPEGARREALRLLGQIAEGWTPEAETTKRERDALTIAQLADLFLREHVEASRKARTLDQYSHLLREAILPKLGKVPAAAITRRDARAFHGSLKDTPFKANRCLAILSKLFNWALSEEIIADRANPCRGIVRFPEPKRGRFLTVDELADLGSALREAEADKPYAVAALRLLIFTGARLREIQTLRWEHVDVERAVLTLPDSKTGEKVIYLSAPALEVLADLPRIQGNPYVIVGHKAGEHLADLQRPWQAIRAAAGLEAVRIHDLRHSFASVGIDGGASLVVVGKLLGHAQTRMTERYAHLSADPVRAASETIAKRIAERMAPADAPEAEVVSLPRKRG